MPSLMLFTRLGGAAVLIAAVAALLLPGVASATDRYPVAHTIWHNRSCQDEQRATFTIDHADQRVRLSVHHVWYRSGKLYVDNASHSSVWTFEQPTHWMVGTFHVETPQLEKGTYSANMFHGDDVGLHNGYCRSTLEILEPGY
jgi:hypothetical protein